MSPPPSTSSRSFCIGIICGSQRKPRAGDQITDFVYDVIRLHSSSTKKTATLTFDYIDINALSLPFYDEPGIPSKIKSAEGYTHEHTRVWSRRVAALDAFVFVTPQYNWGIPAGLKNAIDFLYNEWKGKPAIIISYGGHGGDKAASSLKLCLAGGIDMQITDRMVVNLSFPNRDILYKAARGEPLGLSAEKEGGIWRSERKRIISAWDEMIGMLMAQGVTKVAINVSQKLEHIKLAFQK
jgi:NAD(P)H-dependent FMN reductase